MPAEMLSIRRDPVRGLVVQARYACGHAYETSFGPETSARRASRAEVTRWTLPQGRATRCPACEGFGPHHEVPRA
jgi:hypothetical protein